MRILAIETSTLLGGVAVTDDSSGLIAEVRLNIKSTHSERLMTEMDHVLKRSGFQVSDIDAFALSIGPGSFTGLRIGVSTVKGFSYATGKPIVSVPTFEAFAWNFPFSRYPVCTLFDARRKEVYAALFQWGEGGFVKLIDETSIKIDRLIEKIEETLVIHLPVKAEKHTPTPLSRGDSPSPLVGTGKGDRVSFERVIFAGEGALLYKNEIMNVMGEKAIFAPPDKMVPSPANVASIGLGKALNKEFSEPVSLVPLYIRRSEAEIKWKG